MEQARMDLIARESLKLCGELLGKMEKLRCHSGDFQDRYTELCTEYMAMTGNVLSTENGEANRFSL